MGRTPNTEGQRAVAITGIGVISPVGRSPQVLWNSLVSGRCGIRRRSRADDLEAYPYAADISDFRLLDDAGRTNPETERAIRKASKLMNRDTQLAVAAGQQALADSGVLGRIDSSRIGVCFGAENVALMPEDFVAGIRACIGDDSEFHAACWGDRGLSEVAPLWLLKCLPNMPACYLALLNELRGPNNSITAGAVSAHLALSEGCRLIEDEAADAVLVGGTGSRLAPLSLVHSLEDEEVTTGGTDPATACRPFDRDRTGSVPAEGSGALVLERLDHARSRGATIYGVVAGCASTCAIDADGTPSCREAAASALRGCLGQAGWDTTAIGHLNAHGLGGRRTDAAEAGAIRDVFGNATCQLPVVALKSLLGNAGAGTGALALASSLLALRERRLFPVPNFVTADPECLITPVTRDDVAAGASFLSLSLTSDGRAHCVAISA